MTGFQPLGGGTYQIDMQLCIGGGITGVLGGGTGDTYDLALGIYGPGGGPVNVLSYAPGISPPYLTSANTGCEMVGYDIGPVPTAPFFSQATIYYAWDPFTFPNCANGFMCVTSPALCGPLTQECFNLQIVVDAVPDSIRVFGAEGAGNPVAGCYPDLDMLIDVNTALNVTWGDLAIAQKNDFVELNWETLSELNNDHFIVQRYNESAAQWQQIAVIDGAGNSNEAISYRYLDRDPPKERSIYRIRQVDLDGKGSYSEVMAIELQKTDITCFPNPVDGFMTISGCEGCQASIYGLLGEKIAQVQLRETEHIDLTSLNSGIYSVLVFKEEQLVFRQNVAKK